MKTLSIKIPFGKVVLQSIALLLLFFLAVEALARTTIIKNLHLYESYGSSHPQFDTQVVRIKSRFIKEGHIDCILLGNSQVLSGIDPVVLQDIYLEKNGRPIQCQTFAVGGLVPSTAASLAKVLIKNFHPSIIIFGTSMFDYTFFNPADGSIMSSPWVTYQLGTFSIDGWLIENSNAYRYYLGIDRYMLYGMDAGDTGIDSNGHYTYFGRTEKTEEQLENGIYNILKTLDITDTQVNGLYDLVSLNSDKVKIVVVEMPVYPQAFSLSRYASKIYPDFKNILENETSLAGVELFLTKDIIKIPDGDWYDFTHLNEKGTSYFSVLIGNYLASLALPACDSTISTQLLCEDN